MRDELLFKIGQSVRYLRNKKGISQEELAFRCNLSKNYVSDVERGTRNITLKVVEKFAKGLNVSLTELFCF